jgi:hypothetical protein
MKPTRVAGLVAFADRRSRGRALFREEVVEAQDAIRDALASRGLRGVVGGSPYHPAERLADDDASARLCSHLSVEVRADVMVALVADRLSDPLAVPYLAKYLERRLTSPLPCVVAALVVPAARDDTAAIRGAARAAAEMMRALLGTVIAPLPGALDVRLEDPFTLDSFARELRAVADASSLRPRAPRYENDLRKHEHVVTTNAPETHPDVLAAERLLVEYGVRVRVEPVPPDGRESPPTDFKAAFAELLARRAAARRPTDKWWDDPARD